MDEVYLKCVQCEPTTTVKHSPQGNLVWVFQHWRWHTERAEERGPWVKEYSSTTGDYLATGRDGHVIGVADTDHWWECRYEPEELAHMVRMSPAFTLTLIDEQEKLLRWAHSWKALAATERHASELLTRHLIAVVTAAGFEEVKDDMEKLV